jgi:hypothetical protein
MIKKTFTYENFNGDKVTRDFYFHLSKGDFIELALGGEWQDKMSKAVAEQDKIAVYHGYKEIIALAVGMRSDDGEDFIKTELYRDRFMGSPAYDELIMDLFTSDDLGVDFIKACLPSDMREKLDVEIKKAEASTVDPFADEPAWIKENRLPTVQEYRAATPEQQQIAYLRKVTPKS